MTGEDAETPSPHPPRPTPASRTPHPKPHTSIPHTAPPDPHQPPAHRTPHPKTPQQPPAHHTGKESKTDKDQLAKIDESESENKSETDVQCPMSNIRSESRCPSESPSPSKRIQISIQRAEERKESAQILTNTNDEPWAEEASHAQLLTARRPHQLEPASYKEQECETRKENGIITEAKSPPRDPQKPPKGGAHAAADAAEPDRGHDRDPPVLPQCTRQAQG